MGKHTKSAGDQIIFPHCIYIIIFYCLVYFHKDGLKTKMCFWLIAGNMRNTSLADSIRERNGRSWRKMRGCSGLLFRWIMTNLRNNRQLVFVEKIKISPNCSYWEDRKIHLQWTVHPKNTEWTLVCIVDQWPHKMLWCFLSAFKLIENIGFFFFL